MIHPGSLTEVKHWEASKGLRLLLVWLVVALQQAHGVHGCLQQTGLFCPV